MAKKLTLVPLLLLSGFLLLAWGEEPSLGDVAKSSRAGEKKAKVVVTNDDIPSRPAEPEAPAVKAAANAKPEPKRALSAAAAAAVPCAAEQLSALQEQESSVKSGIEVLRAAASADSDPNQRAKMEALLIAETGKLANLQQQIESARKAAAAAPPDACANRPAADTSAPKPETASAPATPPVAVAGK